MIKSKIFLNVIDTLCYLAQDTYPYQIQNVISNNQLYGNDVKFVNEIDELASNILNELLKIIKETKQEKLQSQIALELFERIVTKADLCEDKIFSLAINLWNLSCSDHNDQRIHSVVLQNIHSMRRQCNSKSHCQRIDDLILRMKNS